MKFGWVMGVTCAVLAHVGVLLFGGILFLDDGQDHGTLQQVELVGAEEVEAEKAKEAEEEQRQEAEERAAEDELEAEEEPAPDSAEVVRNLELSAAASAPRLEAASLSAIEAALSGRGGGGGDFADALSFASGGRIGGLAGAGALEEKLEQAFEMGDIDQKPRVVFQTAPPYPAQMRGRKVEGLVTVICVVDETGRVDRPRVESSSHEAFEKPALDAVKQWKFEPAVKGGRRVSCPMRIPIRFPAS